MEYTGLRTTFHKTTDNGTYQERRAYNTGQLSKWFNHNDRYYDNENLEKYTHSLIDKSLSKYNYVKVINSKDNKASISDYKKWFNQFFETAKNEYNKKQKRTDRKINNVFTYYEKRKQNAIAEQIIISFGDENNIGKLKTNIYASGNEKMISQFNKIFYEWNDQIIQKLTTDLQDFKIYSSNLHMDETTPHLQIIGVPIIQDPNVKNGLKTKLSSRTVFTKNTLQKEHLNLRYFNDQLANQLNSFFKEYNLTFADNKNKEMNFYSIKENKDLTNSNIKSKVVKNLIQEIHNGNIQLSDVELLEQAIHFKENELLADAKINYEELISQLNKQAEKEKILKLKADKLVIENQRLKNSLDKTDKYISANLLVKNTGFMKNKIEPDLQKQTNYQTFKKNLEIENYQFNQIPNENNLQDQNTISRLNNFNWTFKNNHFDSNFIFLSKASFDNTSAKFEQRETALTQEENSIRELNLKNQTYWSDLNERIKSQKQELKHLNDLVNQIFEILKNSNNLKLQFYFLKKIEGYLSLDEKQNPNYLAIKNNILKEHNKQQEIQNQKEETVKSHNSTKLKL